MRKAIKYISLVILWVSIAILVVNIFIMGNIFGVMEWIAIILGLSVVMSVYIWFSMNEEIDDEETK